MEQNYDWRVYYIGYQQGKDDFELGMHLYIDEINYKKEYNDGYKEGYADAFKEYKRYN